MDTQIFDSMLTRVNGANKCEDLTAATAEINASLEALIASAEAQIAKLGPLIFPPAANPGAIVTWINDLIKLIKAPYDEATDMLTVVPQKLDEINAAITSKSEELGCGGN